MTRMASFVDDMVQTQPITLLSALRGRPGPMVGPDEKPVRPSAKIMNVGVDSTVTSTGRIAASALDAFFQILQILTMSAPPQTVRLVPTREATLSTDSSPTSATTSLPLSAPLPLPPELTHNSKFGFAFPDAPGTSLPLIPPLDEPAEPEPKPESTTEGSEAPGSPGDLGATPLPRLARAFSMPVASQLGHLKHPRRPSGFGSPASSSGQPYTPGLSTIHSAPQSAVPQDYVMPKQLPYSGLSLELADTAQLMIQTLLQLSPPHMLDPAREQFSGCTLQLPTTSVGGMLTAMKGLNWMSVRLAGFMEDENTSLDSVVEEHANEVFDVGELLQSAGDVLGGIAAQAGIHVVIYHADVGLKHVGVQGDEGAASYVLSHVVRQVMAVAEPGETIELGLFVDTQGGKTICSFEITHVMHEPVRVPVFDTVITRKLLTHVRATLQARPTPVPSSPSLTAAPDGPSIPAHNSQSYTLTIPFTASPTPVRIPSLTPAEESERQPFPTLRLATEPSLDELAKFSEAQLRGKRATFYAQQTSSFAIHLMSYLTTWGVGVEHRDIEGSEDPSAAGQTGTVTEAGQISFIIIDDDVSILRKRLAQLRSEQLPVPHPRKRPSLAANHRPRSSPHIRPVTHTPSPVVIHFTSLANYKLVRDVVQSILSGCSVEVLVIPKPAGPRRCLVALYTALARPLVDPVFSPIATSPTSPSANMPRVPGAARWGGVGGVTRPSPLAIDSTSTRGYFSGTADLVPDIATSPNTGVVLQDLEGRPAGILFQPKRGAESPVGKKSAPASPTTPGLAGPRKVSVEGRPTPARTRSGSKGAERDGPVRKPSGGPGKRRGSGTEVKSPGAKPGKKKPKESDIVPPISVLIVEDNPINLGILSMFIKRKKIKCDVARDGQQAVEKWKTGRFHLIFMDIQMPVMDGIEATREIRRLEKAQHGSISTPPIESPGLFSESKQLYTPASDSRMFISGPSSPFRSSVVIVALTASSLQSDRVAALAAGCNDFLTKPVSLDWLDKKIIEWGSIKALQMWADPDMVKRQEAKAKAVAGQLRIDRAARTTKSPSRASLESVGGGPKVTGPEIHVQAPTPPAGDQREMEKPALVRRITKSPSPLSRSMVLPGPPPAVVADGEGGKAGIGNGKPPEPEPPADEPVVAEPVAAGVPAVVPTPEIEPIEPIPSISAYPLAEAESYFPPNATIAQCPIEPAKAPEPAGPDPVLLSPSQPGPGTLSPETDTPYQSANSLPPSPS